MSGGTWDGYTSRADDGKPVSAEFRSLFPPAEWAKMQAQGHAEQPSRSLVHPAPSKPGAERPKPRKVTQPKKRAKPKKPASTPGGQQYRRGGKAQ
jgi:hypothetical protein